MKHIKSDSSAAIRQTVFVFMFFLLILHSPAAFDVSFSITENIDIQGHDQELNAILSQDADPFFYIIDFSMKNDGLLLPQEDTFAGGMYYFLNNAGISLDLDTFHMKVGRLEHGDLIDSPYSLFVSSESNPAVLAEVGYDDDKFFYTSRWLKLNENSAIFEDSYGNRLDRGANIKFLGLKWGDLRIAYQDAVVYTGSSFDFDYFANPLPSILTQFIRREDGSPFEEDRNDNALLGWAADYKSGQTYLYGQFLVDDINFNRFFNRSGNFNPDKIAWSLGGRYDTSLGEFGFYHAGATKYTFEPLGVKSDRTDPAHERNTWYGYTYFPDTVFDVGSNEMAIPLSMNYIGFLHGQNSLAFMADYRNRFPFADLYGSLEFMISGSQSPVNPNHEYLTFHEGGMGTKMFDEKPLESRLILRVQGDKRFGDFLVSMGMQSGFILNELELTAVPAELIEQNEEGFDTNDLKLWKPSGGSRALFSLWFGVRYTFSLN